MTEASQPVLAADLDEAVRLTSDRVWKAMRGHSIFLTGGTGFVGKWLLECLLHADRQLELGLCLTVLTREPERFVHASPHLASASAVKLVKGDVVDFEFPAGEFSSVIHAALPVGSPTSGEGALERLAQAGARRVCEFAAASGVRRLLHVSSGAVYGARGSSAPLAEETPWTDDDAVNDYTRAKRLAETEVLKAWPFEVLIARCFAFVGPYLQPSSGAAAAQFIETASNGRGIVVQGTGEAVRTYQYASDMSRWLLSCLVLGAPGRAYNVGGDATVTIAELAAQVTRIAETGVPARIMGQPMPGLAGPLYVPELRRASLELDLSNSVNLDEAIRRTLAWQKASRSFSNAST